MKLNFKGKTAIVTGASGGMGLKTVDKLCSSGIKILMLDIKEPPNKYLKNKYIKFLKLDVTKLPDLKKAIENFYLKYKSFLMFLYNRIPHLLVNLYILGG